jgi:autotransporter-associated beta strand protein
MLRHLLVVFLVLGMAGAASADVYVRGTAGSDTLNGGTGWGDAYATLQKAMGSITSGSTSTIYVEASDTAGDYDVCSKTSGIPYTVTLSGGWQNVTTVQTQTGFTNVKDLDGGNDEDGISISGNGHSDRKRLTIENFSISNVRNGVRMIMGSTSDNAGQWLTLKDSAITSQQHGVYIDYPKYYAMNSYGDPSTVILENTDIVAGQSTTAGDGVHIRGSWGTNALGAGSSFDSASSITTAGGSNVWLGAGYQENNDITMNNSFGAAASGYDVEKHSLGNMIINGASTIAGKIEHGHGLIRGTAQAAGSPFGTTTGLDILEYPGGVTFELDGIASVSSTAIAGAVTFDGLGTIYVKSDGTNSTELTATTATRVNRGVLLVRGTGAMGGNDKFRLTTTVPTITNGMVDAYYREYDGDFLTHGASGFAPATYVSSADINANATTDVVTLTADQTLTADREVYALKTNRNIAGAFDLTLGSGGLTMTSTKNISSNLQFNAVEGVVYVSSGVTGTVSGEVKGSNGLTKVGAGTLRLTSGSNAYTGVTTVHQGTLDLSAAAGETATYAGDVAGGGTLRKSGDGTVVLSGDNSSFSGQIDLATGALREGSANALGTGNLSVFGGGVIELAAGDFTRGVNTGAGQVRFDEGSGGGFAAVGANRAVNMTGSYYNWGSSYRNRFLDSTGSALVLGSENADSEVDFQDGLRLYNNGGTYTVKVVDNPGSAADIGKISGRIYNYNAAYVMTLRKTGDGTLLLSNSTNSYSNAVGGGTLVNEGTLRMGDAGACGTGYIKIATGATLELDGNYALSNVISGTGSVITGSNALTLTGTASPGASVGTLTMEDLVFGDTGSPATYEWESDGVSSDLIDVTGSLVFGGDSGILNVTWLGGGPYYGTHVLFEYDGDDPTFGSGYWTVNGAAGVVSLNPYGVDIGGQVLLTLPVAEPAGLGLIGLALLGLKKKRS